jgi:SAM-dependent methyltransferase
MPEHPADGPALPPGGLLDTAYDLETGEETLAHYRWWAATYDQEIGVDKGYAQPARCAAALAGMTDRPGSVLDVGCGTGLSGVALRDVGFTDVDGCDFSLPMLERAAETGVYRRLFEADLNAGLGVEDCAYDHAVAVGVFSFGHIRPNALRSVIRAVQPGGTVVVGLNDHFWDVGSFPSELEAIEADGLASVVSREHGEHLPGADIMGWVVVLVRSGRAANRNDP